MLLSNMLIFRLTYAKKCSVRHGGGTKNNFLMERLEKNIGSSLRFTDHFIPSKFVESAAFAFLAYLKRGILVEPRR